MTNVTRLEERAIAARKRVTRKTGGAAAVAQRFAIDGAVDPCSHLANARRLARHFAGQLIFVDGIGWHCWGPPWRHDPHAGLRAASSLGRIVNGEAAEIAAAASEAEDAETVRKLAAARLRWATACESAACMQASLTLAAPMLAVSADRLDADPYLLGLPTAVLDLRTCDVRPHDPRDLITKTAGADLEVDAEAPTWRRFLTEILRGDDELIDYMQRLVGYTLWGERPEAILPICWGGGNNGKSTLFRVLQELLGDYAGTAPPDLLIARHGTEHPTMYAGLQGRRLVIVSETGEAGRLAEERVKVLTGNDVIAARRMRQDYYEFTPSHVLFLATNHKPRVQGGDEGIWRRLRLLPFLHHVPPEARDPSLLNKLRVELPGVLRWALHGWCLYRADGFNVPEVVRDATAGYREASDVFRQFLDEACEIEAGAEATSSELYRRYQTWARTQGELDISQKVFGQRLEDRGFVSCKVGPAHARKRAWRGLRLRPEPTTDELL